MNGAGEMLVFSAADFEKFQMPRPELATMMEADLKESNFSIGGKPLAIPFTCNL